MTDPTMTIGAHVSTSGGVDNAPQRGADIGAAGMQLFTRNQKSWTTKPLEPEEIARFKADRARLGIRTVMSHDSYLINLANPEEDKRAKSIAAFEDEMLRCHQLGIELLNFHPGSHLKMGTEAVIETLATALNGICARHPECRDVKLVLENVAGQGTNIGRTLEELKAIIDRLNEPERFAVCIDTCHTFAAGYDIKSQEGWERFWSDFERILGLSRLAAFHVNDCKSDFASRVDRHACLGRGTLGAEPFRRLVTDPRTRHIPMFLETPTNPEGYAKEIAWLKTMAASGEIPPLPELEEGRDGL